MKMSLKTKCALFVGTALCAVGTLTAHADSLITFSVDMSVQITNSTFNPDSDVVSVQGTYNNWASFTQLVREGNTSIYTNTVDDTYEANGISTHYQFVIDS